jgi:hypothetical protein
LDQLRIERAFAVTRNADVDLRRFRQNRLLRIAVAPVLGAVRGFTVEMIVQLGV